MVKVDIFESESVKKHRFRFISEDKIFVDKY